jgi:hypothetical protein
MGIKKTQKLILNQNQLKKCCKKVHQKIYWRKRVGNMYINSNRPYNFFRVGRFEIYSIFIFSTKVKIVVPYSTPPLTSRHVAIRAVSVGKGGIDTIPTTAKYLGLLYFLLFHVRGSYKP